jgi:hypothetical protein
MYVLINLNLLLVWLPNWQKCQFPKTGAHETNLKTPMSCSSEGEAIPRLESHFAPPITAFDRALP